jgi:5-methylcytosine-specific restriction endonuclease McrA
MSTDALALIQCTYCQTQNSPIATIKRGPMKKRTKAIVDALRLNLPICNRCFNRALHGHNPTSEISPAQLVCRAADDLKTGLRRKLAGKNITAAKAVLAELNTICEQYDAVWLSLQMRLDSMERNELKKIRTAGRHGIAREVRSLNVASRFLFEVRQKVSEVITTDYDEARRAANAFCRKEWVRGAVMRRAGWKCQRCPSSEGLGVDHIIPVIRGGENTLENLQALCRSCNSEKGTKQPRRTNQTRLVAA